MRNQTFLLTARARRLGRIPQDAPQNLHPGCRGGWARRTRTQPRQPRRESLVCTHRNTSSMVKAAVRRFTLSRGSLSPDTPGQEEPSVQRSGRASVSPGQAPPPRLLQQQPAAPRAQAHPQLLLRSSGPPPPAAHREVPRRPGTALGGATSGRGVAPPAPPSRARTWGHLSQPQGQQSAASPQGGAGSCGGPHSVCSLSVPRPGAADRIGRGPDALCSLGWALATSPQLHLQDRKQALVAAGGHRKP